MIDLNFFRKNMEVVRENYLKRGFKLDVNKISVLETQRKKAQADVEELRNLRNTKSKTIGQLKAEGEDVSLLLAEVAGLGSELKAQEERYAEVQKKLHDIYLGLPNLTHETVPVGNDESENQEIRRWGTPKDFSFTPLSHDEISGQYMDFNLASKLSGARFVVLKGVIAKLQRALTQFMLDFHTEKHGYTEVYTPFMVLEECLYGTGQMPKFEVDQYFVQADPKMVLLPTAEVSVTNFMRQHIAPYSDLPFKFVCHTPCFRKEAGAYGKDTHGMIRQHQFEKVEMVQIVHPNDSYKALEEITTHAENILQALELPYRVVSLCGGDLGHCAAKTYDLEVWLPSQNKYREISSCSNTEAYQARRMQARFRDPEDGKPAYVHTLNGSGLAVGRTLIALLENHQDASQNIHIPEPLRPYLGGQEKIALQAHSQKSI